MIHITTSELLAASATTALLLFHNLDYAYFLHHFGLGDHAAPLVLASVVA